MPTMALDFSNSRRKGPIQQDNLGAVPGRLAPSLPGDPDTRPFAQFQDYGPYVTDLVNTLFALIRIDDPDFALANDVKAIEKIRRDAVIQQLISYRKHLVAGRAWHLEPGDESEEAKELAALLEWLLKKASNFTTARYRLADAVFIGLSIEKMIGNVKYMKVPEKVSRHLGGQLIPFWYIDKFKDIDKRRVRKEYLQKNEYEREYYWTIFNIHNRSWRKMTNSNQYIFHTYNDEEDTYGFGRGLNEAIFYYWRGKAYLLKYALQFCESFAKPWIRALIAELKGTIDDRDNRIGQYLSVLEKMRAGNVIVGGKEDNIDFMQANTAGQAIIKDMIVYFDEALTRLIIGSMLATRTAQNGSRALGEVHEETTETLVNYDRLILEESITRGAIRALYDANASIIEAAGLGDVELPIFKLDQKNKEDATALLTQVQLAQQVGLQLSQEEVYERTGWSKPGSDEDILSPPSQMPMGNDEQENQPTDEEGNPVEKHMTNGAPDFNYLLQEQGA